MKITGSEFNSSAERFYREKLRKRQLEEALDLLENDLTQIDSWAMWRKGTYNRPMLQILGGRNATDFIRSVRRDLLEERASAGVLKTLIHLTLLSIQRNCDRYGEDNP
jgi:hypothetical protein